MRVFTPQLIIHCVWRGEGGVDDFRGSIRFSRGMEGGSVVANSAYMEEYRKLIANELQIRGGGEVIRMLHRLGGWVISEF